MAVIVEKDIKVDNPYLIEIEALSDKRIETDPDPLELISDEDGFIRIAALDHRNSLSKILPEDKFAEFKALAAQTFLPFSTAILVDPNYGKAAIQEVKDNQCGIILTRESSGYKEVPGGRVTKLAPNATAAKLKDMGANAVKLLLYYNADSDIASKQLSIAKQVKQEASDVGLPVLLEIVTYPIPEIEYHKGDAILRAIKDLRQFADVLKLEYPMDIVENDLESAIPYLNQMTSSAEIPWVLLSHGMKFKTYKKALTISKSEGCKGFAAGRSIWQDIGQLNSWKEQVNFMKTTAKDRFEQISKIFSA